MADALPDRRKAHPFHRWITQPMSDLLFETTEGVALITLNRPRRKRCPRR